MAEVTLTEEQLSRLKLEVLKDKAEEVSQQLGDPGRYFPSFKGKRMLDASDCEIIKGYPTSVERAGALLDIIVKRQGKHHEHPFDVLVKALKDLRVQVHIARILNTELARRRNELESSLRSTHQMHRDIAVQDAPQAGTPNVGPLPVLPPHRHHQEYQPRGLTASSSSGSSVSSSLSSLPKAVSPGTSSLTTSSPLSTRQLPSCDQSPREFEIDPESGPAPNLPFGFSYEGRKISSQQSTDSSFPLSGPLPSLPEGYDEDGKKKNGDIQHDFLTQSDSVNSEYMTDRLPHRTSTGGTSSASDDIFAPPERLITADIETERVRELKSMCEKLTREKLGLKKQCQDLEARLKANEMHLQKMLSTKDDELQHANRENKKLWKRIKELESQMNLLQSPGGSNSHTRIRSPNNRHEHRISDGFMSQSHGEHQRLHDHSRRTSEPTSLSVPVSHHAASRPTNLPLGRTPQEYENGFLQVAYDHQARYRHYTVSPSSDCMGQQTPRSYKSVSNEDLLSADDRGSVRSSNSSHASFDLSSLGNTHGTMV